MELESGLPPLYQPESAADLLTPDTISKLLLGFTAGLDSLPTAIQGTGGRRHDLWGTPERYWSPFCTHFRKELGKEQVCVAWDRRVAQILLGEGEEEYPGQKTAFEDVFPCHAGILDFAEVIRVAGRPFAVLHGGQLVPEDDTSWAQSVRDRLATSGGALTSEQIEHLVSLARTKATFVVDRDQLAERLATFRCFARELEALLEKLYKERRHASEEVLLHRLVASFMALHPVNLEALWQSLTSLFVALRNTVGLAHVEWFMGSEQSRFHLTAKTSVVPEWQGRVLSLGPFWEELRRHSDGRTFGRRWDAKIRAELGLGADHICHIYPLACVYGAPSRNIPAALALVCRNPDAGLLADFLPRLGVEITRAVSTAISEIEKNRVIQVAAAEGAYVGHDMKMPLQVLVNVVPAVRGRIARLGVSDPDLLRYLKKVEDALETAREKATRLEKMPVREFTVTPKKKKLNLVAMLDKVVALAGDLGTRRGVTVRWTSRPEEPVYCDLDARYMPVALHAVLDNAVKFSFAAKTVDVSVERDLCQNAVVKIKNLGVGIPPEERIAIFEFGRRGGVTDKKNVDRVGSGLGLPFSRRIIEAHEGSIDIDSHSTLKPPPEKDDYLSHVVNVTLRLPLSRSI